MRGAIVRRLVLGGMALTLAAAPVACSGGDDGGTEPPGQGNVQGMVADDAGDPVSGATLALSRSGQSTKNATTGAAGTFSFTGVEEGTWSLQVTAPQGYGVPQSQSNPVSVNVTAGGTANVDVNLVKAGDPGDPPQSITVSMTGNSFSPRTDTVAVGGEVTWRNEDQVQHNSTADGGEWTSSNLANGQTFERTFGQAGSFPYSCTLHQGMTGTIVAR